MGFYFPRKQNVFPTSFEIGSVGNKKSRIVRDQLQGKGEAELFESNADHYLNIPTFFPWTPVRH